MGINPRRTNDADEEIFRGRNVCSQPQHPASHQKLPLRLNIHRTSDRTPGSAQHHSATRPISLRSSSRIAIAHERHPTQQTRYSKPPHSTSLCQTTGRVCALSRQSGRSKLDRHLNRGTEVVAAARRGVRIYHICQRRYKSHTTALTAYHPTHLPLYLRTVRMWIFSS